jgi:hypothetical protein
MALARGLQHAALMAWPSGCTCFISNNFGKLLQGLGFLCIIVGFALQKA